MNKALRKYPYGFLFSDLHFEDVPNHYKHINILDKYNYYYDRLLTNNIKIENNTFILIHGHFVQITEEGKVLDNKETLSLLLNSYINNYDKFLEEINYIAGRYVIIVGDSENIDIYPDASSSRSVYYSLSHHILSSHPHFINEVVLHTLDNDHIKAPFLNYTWDYSPYADIKSLICNHKLDFYNRIKTRFFPRKNNQYTKYTEEYRFVLFERLWKGQMKHYSQTYDNLVFSLTGGADSRFTLALSEEYLKNKQSFTYSNERDISNRRGRMFKNDKDIVKELLEYVKLSHDFIYIDQKLELTKKENETINLNTVKQHGRYLIPMYNKIFPEEYTLHIRSNLLELGIARLHENGSKNNFSEVKKVHSKIHIKNKKELINRGINIEKVLEDGYKIFNYDKALYDYHILDLFYIEHRMGRWHTEILNETDSSFDTMLPYNMRALMDISLSFDLKKRKQRYLYNELVNRNYPILNFFRTNEQPNLYELMKDNIYSNENNQNLKSEFKVVTGTFQQQKNYRGFIYIPEEHFEKGNYSEITTVFQEASGYATLNLLSEYYKKNALNHIKYSILVNNIIYYSEDMCLWNGENTVNVFNLKQGDIISIRVEALKNLRKTSWSDASKLKIISIHQIKSSQTFESQISSNSPEGEIFI